MSNTHPRGSGADAWPLISVEEALEIVLREAVALPATLVSLYNALGTIAARAIVAQDPLPPFPASVKDGYAVVAGDGAGERSVVQSVTAGEVSAAPLQPGEVAYITTGAPLPAGADAVVQVEDTEGIGAHRVRILRAVAVGHDVRQVGSDIAAGDVVVPAGIMLGPAEIGLAATVGAVRVHAHRGARVGILSTGNELVPPDQPLRAGTIRESNGAMLAAAVRLAGGEVIDLGIVRDEESLLRAAIASAQADCDVLLSTGGVSMGELDLMKRLAADMGTVHFGRIRMKPGKPCTFATLPKPNGDRDLLYFGLPGNPVSALTTFWLLALPAIRALAGWREPRLKRVQAVIEESLPLDSTRPEYHRARIHWQDGVSDGAGGYWASSTGNQASSRLFSFSGANALLVIPQGEGRLQSGSVVDAFLLPEG